MTLRLPTCRGTEARTLGKSPARLASYFIILFLHLKLIFKLPYFFGGVKTQAVEQMSWGAQL